MTGVCSKDGKITIEDLTGGEVRGGGDFDELMRTVNSMIQEQYCKNRITGASYSTVYLGAMQTVLQVASQFTLTKCKSTYESLLMEEQITQAEEQTCLIQEQVRNLQADTAIKTCQLDLMDAEKLGAYASTCLTNAKRDETAYTTCCILPSQYDINVSQCGNIVANTGYVNQQCLTNIQQETLLTCQQVNTAAQTSLTCQKVKTEISQISDELLETNGFCVTAVCGPNGEGVLAYCMIGGGVLGSQKALYQKQIEGYDRDAKSKMAKVMTDTWTVRQSTDGALVTTAGLNDTEINKVLNVAKASVGVDQNLQTDTAS